MYSIVRLLSQETIEDLLSYSETARMYKTGVVTDGESVYNPDYRSTTAVRIDPKLFPEVCESIETYIDDDTVVNQFDFLIYNVGDYFKRHRDTFVEEHLRDYRVWTAITMLDKSDDLRGGSLLVDKSNPIHLEIGDTIIFHSDLEHEAQEVIQGYRKVLVSWLGKYKYN